MGIEELNLIAWSLHIVDINDRPSVSDCNRPRNIELGERMVGDCQSVVLQPNLLVFLESCVLCHRVTTSVQLSSDHANNQACVECAHYFAGHSFADGTVPTAQLAVIAYGNIPGNILCCMPGQNTQPHATKELPNYVK